MAIELREFTRKSIRMARSDSSFHFPNLVLRSDPPSAPIARLRSRGREISVARGRVATLQKQDGRWLVLVLDGAVKLVAQVGPDREQIVGFAFEGEILTGSPPSHTPYLLKALIDCRLAVFSAGDLIRFAATGGGSADALLTEAFSALDRSRERAVSLGRKSAQEKLSSFLLDMAERIGLQTEEVVVLRLPMTRRDMADNLGLTIETVSRQLTDLRDQSIIQTRGRSEIVLLNPQRLRELASRHQ